MNAIKELVGGAVNSLRTNGKQFAVSGLIHALVFAMLTMFVVEVGRPPKVATVLSELAELPKEEILQEELVPDDQIKMDAAVSLSPSGGTGSVAGTVGTAGSAAGSITTASQVAAVTNVLSDKSLSRPLSGRLGKMSLDSNVVGLKGVSEMVGGEGGGDAGVVDRITQEILRQLDKNKVLVCWIFDSTRSLRERRAAIATRFERVYKEIDELGVNEKDALMTAVVACGKTTVFRTDKPTNDTKAIQKAIKEMQEDDSGVENLFAAVKDTGLKFRSYQTSGRRTMMIVLVTDEVGDDEKLSDETTQFLMRNKIPFYVMAPQATFTVNVIHQIHEEKREGHVFRFWLPMKRGPYTRRDEVLRAPFNHQTYNSGFGAFHLTQMSRESGGIYFIYDDARVNKTAYNMDTLVRYKANYGPSGEYNDEIKQSKFRMALMNVIDEGNPALDVSRLWWGHHWIHAQSWREEV
ncbi:MAG: vWA domain-containing protein, partial [Planctomycetia bacterium]